MVYCRNIIKTAAFLFVLFFNSQVYAYCLQSFNGYGPIYAPSILQRTNLFMKEILEDQCEVVHLQEIWNVRQIRKIEEAVDLTYISFAPNTRKKNGLMSLSRWNVSKTEYHSFQHNTDGSWFDRSRRAIGVEKGFAVQWLKTPIGDMAFINLHLHPVSKAVRIAQIMDLIAWRMKNSEAPIVLTGDFNMTPDSLEKSLVVHGLKVKDAVETFWGGYKSEHCTYCSSNRLSWLSDDRFLDYFFYSGPLKITDVQINLKGSVEQPYSDHYGVKVSWEFDDSANVSLFSEGNEALQKTLNDALKEISLAYTEQSELCKTIEAWIEELSYQSGTFWSYYQQDKSSQDEKRVALDSGLAP